MPSRPFPHHKCERPTCSFPASMILIAHAPRDGNVTGDYPERQALCASCVVTEVRVADRMGYTPDGEAL